MLKLSVSEDYWEILPYKLAFARKVPAAISMNVDPFIKTDDQDCINDFSISTNSASTFHNFQPVGTPHVFVILEDQQVLDFDASKHALELSTIAHESWPTSIVNCQGTYYSNYFITTGGPYIVRYLFINPMLKN